MENNKTQYIRNLCCYYDVIGEKELGLGYQEGNDRLGLKIGRRRTRWIENIDIDFLYIVLNKTNEFGNRFIYEYKKIEVEKVNDEYVIDVQKLLYEYHLLYELLDSRAFQKVKVLEEERYTELLISEEMCPYAYVIYDKGEVYYEKNAFHIGDVSIEYIRVCQFSSDIIHQSTKQKTTLDFNRFSQLINIVTRFSWDKKNHIYTNKYDYMKRGTWYYHAYLDNNGEKKEVRETIRLGEKNALNLMYKYMQCKNYIEYSNLVNKIKLLGVK